MNLLTITSELSSACMCGIHVSLFNASNMVFNNLNVVVSDTHTPSFLFFFYNIPVQEYWSMFTLFNHEAFRDIVSVIDQSYDRPLHLQIINNEPVPQNFLIHHYI